MQLNNRYKAKYFSILGDSISTFEGVSIPKEGVFYDTAKKLASDVITADDTWWGIVIKELGGRLLINNSISGSTVTGGSMYEYQSYGCSDERTNMLGLKGLTPDVIMIYLGTNDWGQAVRIKSKDSSNGTIDSSVFTDAYAEMLKKVKSNYPQAEIWCFTLSTSIFLSNKKFQFPYYYGGWHISEYCEVIRQQAKEYGCRLVELFKDTTPFDTFDGFHPNKDGMKTLAKNILLNIYKKN